MIMMIPGMNELQVVRNTIDCFEHVVSIFFSMERGEDVFDSLRELELRLLESQVVGSTRDATKVAYAQAGEDVTRAVPLLRMATLLADRMAMVIFMMNQNPYARREQAEWHYENCKPDVVRGVVNMEYDVQQFFNGPDQMAPVAEEVRDLAGRTLERLMRFYRANYYTIDFLEEAQYFSLIGEQVIEQTSPSPANGGWSRIERRRDIQSVLRWSGASYEDAKAAFFNQKCDVLSTVRELKHNELYSTAVMLERHRTRARLVIQTAKRWEGFWEAMREYIAEKRQRLMVEKRERLTEAREALELRAERGEVRDIDYVNKMNKLQLEFNAIA